METNTTLTEGLWVMIQQPINDPAFEDTELNAAGSDEFRDTYDYFPDFGI